MSGRGRSLMVSDLPRIFVETRSILVPVLACIALTQVAWVTVYDCTATKDISGFGFWNKLSASSCEILATIVISYGVMLTTPVSLEKIVQAYLTLDSLLATRILFHDGAARLQVGDRTRDAIARTLTGVYGSFAMLAFFTRRLPYWCIQLFVVTNCAAVATFFLTITPGNSAWFLLAVVALWDIVVIATRPAARMIAFRDHCPSPQQLRLHRVERGEEDEVEGFMAMEEDEEYIDMEEEYTASTGSSYENLDVERYYRALRLEAYLGFGDFIFYSILVGKSMAVGFLPAIVTTIGVITGLACSLILGQKALPALSISIDLGMIGHYSTVACIAALEHLYNADIF